MRTVHVPRAHRDPEPWGATTARQAPGENASAPRSHLAQAVLVGLGPSLLLLSLLYHPYLDDLRDKGTVAAEMTGDTTRWGVAHLAVGLAAALVLLAFLAVDAYLRESGTSRASAAGVPFIVVGTVLFVYLPAMEIAMLSVFETGADVEGAMLEMNSWFVPVLFLGAAVFGVGAVLFAVAVARSRVLGRRMTWLVVTGFVVAALSRFVPLGAALLVGGAALVAAMLPLAAVMLTVSSQRPDATAGRG